nr:hypothetical protein K-LCC10_0275 [Kaumoebavirus]
MDRACFETLCRIVPREIALEIEEFLISGYRREVLPKILKMAEGIVDQTDKYARWYGDRDVSHILSVRHPMGMYMIYFNTESMATEINICKVCGDWVGRIGIGRTQAFALPKYIPAKPHYCKY